MSGLSIRNAVYADTFTIAQTGQLNTVPADKERPSKEFQLRQLKTLWRVRAANAVKLATTRDELAASGVSTALAEFNLCLERLRIAELKLRIALLSNELRKGATHPDELEHLKRRTLVRWGVPVHGVQIGIECLDLRDTITSGASIEICHRVRNTTAKELTVRLQLIPSATLVPQLDAQRRIALTSPAEPSELKTFVIPPETDIEIPGSRFTVQTHGLPAAHYAIRSDYRARLNQATGDHPLVTAPSWNDIPSELVRWIEVTTPPNTPHIKGPEVQPQTFVLRGTPEIEWGSPVIGIQGGLRYPRGLLNANDFQHPSNWSWDLGQTVQAEFLVRNTSSEPVTVQFLTQPDGAPIVVDYAAITLTRYDDLTPQISRLAKGVQAVRTTPRIVERTLKPGELALVALVQFPILKLPHGQAEREQLPALNAMLLKPAERVAFDAKVSVTLAGTAPQVLLESGRLRLWPVERVESMEPATVAMGLKKANSAVSPDATDAKNCAIEVQYPSHQAGIDAELVLRSVDDPNKSFVQPIRAGTTSSKFQVEPGHYEVLRRITLCIDMWRLEVDCNRQQVVIDANQTITIQLVRQKLATAPEGVWQGLVGSGLPGGFLTLHPLENYQMSAGTPESYADFRADRRTIAATTCNAAGEFSFEPVPAGRYLMILRTPGKSHFHDMLGSAMPVIVGAETFQHYERDFELNCFPGEFRIREYWNLIDWKLTRSTGKPRNADSPGTRPNSNTVQPQPGGTLQIGPVTRPSGKLIGRFVLDGKVPERDELQPKLSQLKPGSPVEKDRDGRYSGVEMFYREYLNHGIRPDTLDRSLLVDKHGGIQNILIAVISKEIPLISGPNAAGKLKIKVNGSHYDPRLTVARPGQMIIFENEDPVPMSFHLYGVRNPEAILMLSPSSLQKHHELMLAEPENVPIAFRSDQLNWARGWIFVSANPYVAVTASDGTFTVPNLPPGEWEFRVWHERTGYLKVWPQGRFVRRIESGDNDLGTVKVPVNLFQK